MPAAAAPTGSQETGDVRGDTAAAAPGIDARPGDTPQSSLDTHNAPGDAPGGPPCAASGTAAGATGDTPSGSAPSGQRGRLIVVRHGATEWSRAGRHTGRTDVPLLDQGRRQAEMLGRLLAGHVFALVLTSPLRRARETCEIAGFGPVARVSDDLREWDYGAYEGRTTSDIRAERPGWSLWDDGGPGGESAEDVGRRADRVVAEARAVEGDVLAFAHAHVLRVVGVRWLGLPPREGRLLVLDPATISVLGWEREVAVVTRWNDTTEDPLA